MEKIYRSIAGMDVHQKQVTVCVLHEPPKGCKKVKVKNRVFGTTTKELRELNKWINIEHVEAVVMESTGQYWRPVWNMMMGDFDKILAHPNEVKNLRGRKTDRRDAEHIADVTMHGLVRGSYIPDEETQELRLVKRTQLNYQKDITRKKNQIHNILQTANIKLTTYLSDIFGATGRLYIQLLLDGEAITLEKVESLRHSKIKASAQQLFDSLDGALSGAQRIVLTTLFQSIDETQAHIVELDELVKEHTSKHLADYERLQELPGVSAKTAEIFMAEVGWNVDAFPTKEHLASWAGLCPGSYESGGVRKSAHITQGNKRLKGALTQAALVASHSKDERFRAKYQRIKAKAGAQKAIIAIAHQLLIIMYTLIKNQTHYDPNFAKKRLYFNLNIAND